MLIFENGNIVTTPSLIYEIKFNTYLSAARHSVNLIYNSTDARFNLSTPIPNQTETTTHAVHAYNYSSSGGPFGTTVSDDQHHKAWITHSNISIIYLGNKDLYWYHPTTETC